MLLFTTENITGKPVKEHLGLVKGSTVRAKWFGKDIIASLRNIIGGEVKEYTEMMTESRDQAVQRMITEAEDLGADAIVGIRFATSQTSPGAAEFLVYGTAVKV